MPGTPTEEPPSFSAPSYALPDALCAVGPRTDDERIHPAPGYGKRVFDVVLSSLALVLSVPWWPLIALAIKLDDGGPVLFRQQRVGRHGRSFVARKFRSMAEGSDRDEACQSVENDPRVTRVGRFLRASALDELPQLWNILLGDMSFVGPRPLMPREIEARGDGSAVSVEEIQGHELRHRVRPGLTGLAQVYAPRDLPRYEKFRIDRIYVQQWSFWLDLKLILLSLWLSVRGACEYRGRRV